MSFEPNPNLLVCPAIFQNFIEGKDGQPLSNGVITFYEDADHFTLKNVFQQEGSFNNYSYTAVNNPLTLSAAGTTVDVNGNDILLFFYPWSETDENVSQPYFITVYDQYGTLQFTRSNFPFDSSGSANTSNLVTQENYIINNRFWRNIGTIDITNSNFSGVWTTQYSTTANVNYWTLAPDQHDGFSMPDFNYIVPNSVLGHATETITFEKFTATPLNPTLVNDIQPEYFINHFCSNDSGTYTKIYQFPISLHLATLANQPFVFTIQGMGSITINIGIYAFAGTGTPSPIVNPLEPIQLTSPDWNKFTRTGFFPSNFGIGASSSGDDAYYLQIQFSSGTADFSFAIPSLYIYDNSIEKINGDELFSFSTYDQVDSEVLTPRTGDLRTSLNSFYPFGWVPMNNGTIGNAMSNATARPNIDTWPLFSLMWTMFSPYNNGSTNVLAQMKDSSGMNIGYGGSALIDFNNNRAITLSPMMGRVMLGTVPFSAYLNVYATQFSASSSGGLLITTTNNVNFYNGIPIYFTLGAGGVLPTGLSLNTIYYAANFNGTNSFNVSDTFEHAISGTNLVPWTDNGSPIIGVVSSLTGSSEGEYAHMQLLSELANHAHVPATGFSSFLGQGGSSFIVNAGAGSFSNEANTGLISGYTTQTAANVTQPGTYFNIYIKL